MSAFFVAWAAVTCWLVASRWLYRRWTKAGTFRGGPCYSCDRPVRLAQLWVVLLALGAAAILPATLAVLWIMHDTPLSPEQVQERIEAAERANRKLDEQIRRAQ